MRRAIFAAELLIMADMNTTRTHDEVRWNRDKPSTKKKKFENKGARGSRDIRQMFGTTHILSQSQNSSNYSKGHHPLSLAHQGKVKGKLGRSGKRPPSTIESNEMVQYLIPPVQSSEMVDTVQYLVARTFIYERTGEPFMVDWVYYDEDIDQIVGYGTALNREWRNGDDAYILVYGPDGLIDLSDQWIAREDADQHTDKIRPGKRPPPAIERNVVIQYPIPSSQSMAMEETVQYLVDRTFIYESTGETFIVEMVYYEEDIDQIVGYGRALNRQWRTGDDEPTLVYGPGGLIDLTNQWTARDDADQHAEKRHRGSDSDRDNEDNYIRLDNQTPCTITSIAIGKIKPSKKPNKKHREDDKMP
jgi:hypothetical protein